MWSQWRSQTDWKADALAFAGKWRMVKIHKCHSSVVLGSWASLQKFALLVTPPSWYVPGSPVSWVKVQVIGKYYAYGKTKEFITCFGSSLHHRQRPGPAAQHLACRVPQRPGLLVKQWWRPFSETREEQKYPDCQKKWWAKGIRFTFRATENVG